MTFRDILIAVLFALGSVHASAQGREAVFDGAIADGADVLSPAAEAEIAARIDAITAQTGTRVLILTSPDLGGEDASELANRTMIEWLKDKPRPIVSAIILIAPNDREASFSASHFLGKDSDMTDLTDEMAQDLGQFTKAMESGIEVVMTPMLRTNDFEGALKAFAVLAESETLRIYGPAAAADDAGKGAP